MAVNYKNPPEMREDLLYADWKTELEIWRSFTDLAQAKQGPAVFLSLKGKARQTALAEVKPADLAKDTGVDTILNTLDKLYVKDVCDAAYSAFGNFCKLRDLTICLYLTIWLSSTFVCVKSNPII